MKNIGGHKPVLALTMRLVVADERMVNSLKFPVKITRLTADFERLPIWLVFGFHSLSPETPKLYPMRCSQFE